MPASPAVLKRFDIFAGLPGDALEAIAPLAEERHLPDGTVLFGEGAAASSLFLILDGKVSLEKRVQLGRTGTPRRAAIEVAGAWQAVGWSSMVHPFVYTSSGVCQGPVTVLAI